MNQSISMLKSKQRIQSRSKTKLKDYLSKGFGKPYEKNLSNKYREIFSNFSNNPKYAGDVATTVNESPSLADLEQSLKDLDDQLMPAEIFRSERAEIHHEIAKIHRRDGNYDAAYANNISAINYREKDEDYVGLSRSYNNLGLLELDFDKYSQAEENFNKSIEIKEEHNLSKDSVIISLKNLSSCYEKSRSFEEQESVLKRALNLSIETKNKKRHFELSHLLHEYHEVHNDKDIYEKKSPYDGMLIEHPFYLDSNEILNLDLQGGHSFKPFVIQGSAGMGKTVVMTQIGLQYVTRIKKMLDYDGIGDMSFTPFPIFIKGRNVTHSELKNTYELESLILGSNPDLSKYISSDELVDLLDIWKKYSHYHFGSFSIFVDAVDEMKNHEIATDFLDWVTTHRSFRTSRRPLIFMSTRPSHTDILPSNCSFSLMRQNYYSKKELSVEMPKKLCDAWGITREITDTFQESFDSYEDILIHPLFVGWFCFLIQQGYEDKMLLIGSSKDNNSDEKIGEIEVFDSKLQYRKTTLLTEIINIGIDASLDRKKRNVKDKKKFSDLVKKFVALSYHYSIYKPEILFRIIEEDENIVISDYDKESLVDDCGILFLAGENIEWTHGTIPEIIYTEYYYNLEDTIGLGPMKLTDPILYKYALLEYLDNNYPNYGISVMRTFHYIGFDHLIDAPRLRKNHLYYFLKDERYTAADIADENLTQFIEYGEDGSLINSVSVDSDPYAHELIAIFLDTLGTEREFLLPPQLIWRVEVVMEEIDKLSTTELGLLRPIHPDMIDIGKIPSTLPIKEMFDYYLNVRDYYEDLDFAHPVFKHHANLSNSSGIFDQTGIAAEQLMLMMNDDFKFVDFEPKLYFENYEKSIDIFRRELVLVAFEKLIRSSHTSNYIDKLWNSLVDLPATSVIEPNKIIESWEDKTLLTYLNLHRSFFMVITRFSVEIPDLGDLSGISEILKADMLKKFVFECLKHIKGEESLLSYYIEMTDFWLPFELVKAYASNLD